MCMKIQRPRLAKTIWKELEDVLYTSTDIKTCAMGVRIHLYVNRMEYKVQK